MDLKQLAESIGLDEDEFNELLSLFIETSRSDLIKLREGLQEGDHQKVSSAAHSIKGAAGNMGFTEIYETAKEVEMDARKKVLDNAETGAAAISDELTKLEKNLNL